MSKKNIQDMLMNSPDKNYLQSIINSLQSNRFINIGLIILVCICLFLIYGLINKPAIITIIDKTTGETYATVSSKMNSNILQKQIMYYSKKFAEEYLSLDGTTVIEKRKSALEMLHPATREKIGNEEYYKTKEVANAIEENYRCTFKWTRMPVITKVNHPRYTAFMQFERVIEKKGYKPVITPYNVKIDWVWLKGMDPFEKPHNISVIEFTSLEENTEEFKNQLNLSYK